MEEFLLQTLFVLNMFVFTEIIVVMINWQQDFLSSNSVCSHTLNWQIGLLLGGHAILLITRLITDRIGLHSVLLPLFITVNMFHFFLDYGWVLWHTAFEMPAAKASFQYMFIYFKGPKPTVDILLDDLYLGEILQRPDWKEHSDALIDKYRKRNVRLRSVEAGIYYSSLNAVGKRSGLMVTTSRGPGSRLSRDMTL